MIWGRTPKSTATVWCGWGGCQDSWGRAEGSLRQLRRAPQCLRAVFDGPQWLPSCRPWELKSVSSQSPFSPLPGWIWIFYSTWGYVVFGEIVQMFLLNNGGVQESLHTAEWWFGNFSFSTLDTAQALSQLPWLNWTFSTPLVAQGLGCSIYPYSMFGSFNLTSAPQIASVGKEKDCGLRNQHSFLSSGQDLCASNYYESASRETRKGCEGNTAREWELAKSKVPCDFPRAAVTMGHRRSGF